MKNKRKRVRALLALATAAMIVPAQVRGAPPVYTPGSALEVATEAPPGELLVMKAGKVVTWEVEDLASPTGISSVVQLGDVDSGEQTGGKGRIEITIDQAKMSAKAAVIWISRSPGTVVDSQLVRISLLGDATLEQEAVKRSGPNLFVTAVIRGSIRIASPTRMARNESSGATFTVADNLRKVAETPSERVGPAVVARAAGEPTPTRDVQGENIRPNPIRFTAGNSPTIEGPDGKMAWLVSNGVTVFENLPDGGYLEMRAERGVVLTNARTVLELADAQSPTNKKDVITAVYLEGDVRARFVPGREQSFGEQRLEAERIYYDFATNRAMLTDAVMHTVDPSRNLPIVFRAKTIEQIANGQYNAEKVELSTSQFAVPTYAVRASRIFVRQTGAKYEGDRSAGTTFRAEDVTLNTLGLPVLYLPAAGGDATNFPLRSAGFEDSSRFGVGVRTQWGLFETLGYPHPKDLDISYRADYLNRRGPATGLDADYRGGLVTETTAEPWNFQGHVKSYLILDDATDKFAGDRRDVDPKRDVRGQVLFEHQHFLPEDWQVQIRAGYSSDATFLEQYFQHDYDTQLPYELAFYAKKQKDSEQLSLLATTSLSDFPTTADLAQEQTFVQRYPELGYRRLGDSVGDDRFTFFSENTASILSFRNSTTSLRDQGYPDGVSPGFKSFGETGTAEDTVLRADMRQELDFPTQLGQFKLAPYVVGRYSPYSESATSGSQQRVYAAAGARMTTAFWRTDDQFESEMFDIHRVRHVVEPVINVYTSGTTVDTNKLYIYDEAIDQIYDVSAANLRLEQRWQTKRGGPGRWRSVDFLTLNVEANVFTNDPDPVFINPAGSNLNEFRGLFFDTHPETSVPRDSINADASWRVTDTMILLADEQYNVDENKLATGSVGLAVQRDPRLTYYIEQRYVQLLNSNITSFSITYQLSAKYIVAFQQSYDFSQTNNVSTSVTVSRLFDRVMAALTVYTDSVNDETGVKFVITPQGLGSHQNNANFFTPIQTNRERR